MIACLYSSELATTRMVLRIIFGLLIIASATAYLQAAKPQSQTSSSVPDQQRILLTRYCVTCHNQKLKTAGLMLDKMEVEKISENLPEWEKVIRKLRTYAMPPPGLPRPDKTGYDSIVTYLETSIDAEANAHPNPGRPVAHRLNRAEYANAIKDLLSLDADVESLLPPDDSGYGFDNIGDVLSVSPALLERYILAAGKIRRLAIGDVDTSPAFETYDMPRLLMQDERMSEELPFGSRGGIAIRRWFPLDAEYLIKIRLQRRYDQDFIVGLETPHQIELRVDGARVKVFAIGGEQSDNDTGTYRRRNAADDRDKQLEIRLPIKAGSRLIAVDFTDEKPEPAGAFQPLLAAFRFIDKRAQEIAPAVGSVIIGGPYNSTGAGDTTTRRKIFLCRPSSSLGDEACAAKILSTLARRAYRRPVTDEDVQPLLRLYDAGTKERGFEAGIGTALEGILVCPEFLFRIERDPVSVAPNTVYRLTDLELASRLSFFLWSSIPDDQLLDVAIQGKLKNREVLERQVRRMLADPRSDALVSNFAGQWLYLRNLRSVLPDAGAFPEFDENLRRSFQRETELFLESNIREDRGLLELLSANYTFLNERLAHHYGIPNIYGSHFRRVTLTDENRWGLMGQGSILTVTSYANRTSPVARGKWLLENVLGTPPPPPPPNVPSLKENGENGKFFSMRQQMEQHRANPACAVCHTRMDPLGFAMENFNGIGEWRTTDANAPIDASGSLPDGTKFKGPAELRKVLLSKPEQFVNTVTEKLLTYALGRGFEYYDEPAVRKIIRDAAPYNYSWSSLILGIVNSTPFQAKRSRQQ